MGEFYRQITLRAFVDTPALVSSNWVAVFVSLFILSATFVIKVRRQESYKRARTWAEKLTAMRQHWAQNLRDGFIVTVAVWAGLFVISFSRTLYLEHVNILNKAATFEQERNMARTERDALKEIVSEKDTTIRDLQEKITNGPKGQQQTTYFQINQSRPHPPARLPLAQPGLQSELNIPAENAGSYLAEDAYAVAALEIHDIPSPFDINGTNESTPEIEDEVFAQFKTDTANYILHPQTDTYAPHDGSLITARTKGPLTETDVSQLAGERPTKLMYLIGFTEWKDGDGKHEWRFCRIIQPPIERIPPVYEGCRTHNGFMRVALD